MESGQVDASNGDAGRPTSKGAGDRALSFARMKAVRELVAAWNSIEAGTGVEPAQRSRLREPPGSDASPGGALPPVLLVHGGGGSPADLEPLALDLARRGRTVLAPLLPAHGRGDDALGELRFDALSARALEAFDALAAASARPIPVVGLSLGGVLGIRIAVLRPAAAFVALAPALRPFVVSRALALAGRALVNPRAAGVRYRWQREVWRGIRATEAQIARLAAPLLVIHSRDDSSVSIRGARLLHDGAASAVKRLHVVDGQGHVLTQAPEPEVIFAPLRDFLREHAPAPSSPGDRT